jgi:hypothetical protein
MRDAPPVCCRPSGMLSMIEPPRRSPVSLARAGSGIETSRPTSAIRPSSSSMRGFGRWATRSPLDPHRSRRARGWEGRYSSRPASLRRQQLISTALERSFRGIWRMPTRLSERNSARRRYRITSRHRRFHQVRQRLDDKRSGADDCSSAPRAWSLRVPKGGLEPPRACAHCALNAARLPVPPLRQGTGNVSETVGKGNAATL